MKIIQKALLLSFFICYTFSVRAQILKQFTFHGKLPYAEQNFTGTKKIEYTIYDLNKILWREVHPKVSVNSGIYDAMIGKQITLPSNLFTKKIIERTLVIKIDGITQGFIRLPNTITNNSYLDGTDLTANFESDGKFIDFDKIKAVETSRDFQKAIKLFHNGNGDMSVRDQTLPFFNEFENALAALAGIESSMGNRTLLTAMLNAFVNKSYPAMINMSNDKYNGLNFMKFIYDDRTGDMRYNERTTVYMNFPLNQVDDIDGQTVLDYLYDKYLYMKTMPETVKNKRMRGELVSSYRIVKAKGGRHYKYENTEVVK